MKIKDWSERLVWATILVGVVRYAAAFAASDVGQITGIWSNILTILLSITGIGMGVLDTVGGGLLFNGWSRVFPKAGQRWSLRFKVLTLCVFGLLFSGMFILVPFTMSRIAQESVLDALGGKNSVWAWVWSSMVNLIPYILIAGVFTGNKMVSELESGQVTSNYQESSRTLTSRQESTEKVTSNLPADWRKIKEKLTDKQISYIANNEPKDIVKEFARVGIEITPRTASNWRTYAADELQVRIKQ